MQCRSGIRISVLRACLCIIESHVDAGILPRFRVQKLKRRQCSMCKLRSCETPLYIFLGLQNTPVAVSASRHTFPEDTQSHS